VGAAVDGGEVQGGLEVIGVSVDGELAADKVLAFARKRNANFTLWFDPGEALARAMGVTTLPGTFLLDRKSKIIWHSVGAITAGDVQLRRRLEAALATDGR